MKRSETPTETWNIQSRPNGEWRWLEWGQFDYSDATYLKVESDLKIRATQNGTSYRVLDGHNHIVFQATP